mmetsp:Transcript_28343/g.67085  ORF Transcript_28343/g.67085 Transcript_28343/m.67085 type:complete len:91 (-) Transcript_28343:1339-1611(-)
MNRPTAQQSQQHQLTATAVFLCGFIFPFIWLLSGLVDHGTKSPNIPVRQMNQASMFAFYLFMGLFAMITFMYALVVVAESSIATEGGHSP